MTTIPRCPNPSSRYRLPLVLLFCTLVALFAAATTQAQTCSVPKTFTLDTNKVPQPPQSATNASCEWDLFSW